MGPEFLWKPDHEWPVQTEAFSNVPDEDPEVKPGVTVSMSLDKHNSSLSDYFLKCFSWTRLKTVVS